ncbi:PAS domain S-box protein, partial [Klebsiella pneumoniae]|uniref:PAS domain S-box protein n=1 Tax=Klebsiella pneumoniae TaxID=573 RepID=UPI002246C639
FENNPDAVYSTDLDGNFLPTNPSCVAITGYEASEISERSSAPLVAPEDLERAARSFERAARGETQNFDIGLIHKDGHRVELNLTNVPNIVGRETVGVDGL